MRYLIVRDRATLARAWDSFTLQSPLAPEVSDYNSLKRCILDDSRDFRDNRLPPTAMPVTTEDFTRPERTIGSINTKGIRGQAKGAPSFVNSIIAAFHIRRARLGFVPTDSGDDGGAAFGLAARTIGAVLGANEDGNKFPWLSRLSHPTDIASSFDFGDFKLQLVRETFHLVRSIATPGTVSEGLAWDGSFLWNADFATERIYQLDTITGTVISSIRSPVSRPVGLTWRAATGTFWGGLQSTLTSPGSGLAWAGDVFYVTDATDQKILMKDTGRNTLAGFDAPEHSVRDLAWDGQSLWAAAFGTDTLYRLSPTGDIVETVSLPDLGITGDPTGLT